jgi:tripartite-type tricarboxylate transporter receptor subunit TctC
MTAEFFKSSIVINVMHVPYKGATSALVAVVAGEADFAFYYASAAMQYVKHGRLRALATTGEKRSQSNPDLPTVAESGVNGFETLAWSGLLAPAETPKFVIMKLYNELVRILQIPETKERLAAIDFEPVGNTPEAFATYIQKDIQKWAKVVKDSGTKED